MKSIISQYRYVILDFSAMFVPLKAELIQALNEAEQVVVAPTFATACAGVAKAASRRIQLQYQKNCTQLAQAAQRVWKRYGVMDTLRLAGTLSRTSGPVLVVAANYTLEDQMVLRGLQADLYSLQEERVLQAREYPLLAKRCIMEQEKTPLRYQPVGPGDWVYLADGPCEVSEHVFGGKEAEIYRIKGRENQLLKLYKLDEDDQFLLTRQKLEHIQALAEINQHWDIPWLALPISIAFADPQQRIPVGYVMEYFQDLTLFAKYPLFSGGPMANKLKHCGTFRVRDTLELCLCLAGQILFLAANDLHITDYNDLNFAFARGKTDCVVLIDTDSFAHEGYVPDCFTYAGQLLDGNDIRTWRDVLDLCDQSLAAFVLAMLVLDTGSEPFLNDAFRFSEEKLRQFQNPTLSAQWESIPLSLRGTFRYIFEQGNPASIEELLYALERAQQSPLACRRYEEIFGRILAQRSAGEEPNPVPHAAPAPKQALKLAFPPQPGPGASPLVSRRRKTAAPKASRFWSSAATFLIFFLAAAALFWIGQRLISGQPVLPDGLAAFLPNQESPDGSRSDETGLTDGYAECRWDDGKVYMGYLADGLPSGYGTLYDAAGDVIYDGEWSQGLFDGTGNYYLGGYLYQAVWENGTCLNGEPMELTLSETGETIAIGYWEDNIFYGRYYLDGQWYDAP